MRQILIKRTRPFELESLESFLGRLGSLNSYDETNWFAYLNAFPREIHLNHIRTDGFLHLIAEVSMVPVESLRAMTIHRYAKYFYQTGQSFWEEKKRNSFIQASTPSKICPLCYSEKPCFLLPWLIRPITTCPKHRLILTDTCMRCQTPLLLRNGGCKKCGSNFISDRGQNHLKSILEQNLAQITWISIGGDSGLAKNSSTDSFPLFQMPSFRFFDYLWKMGALLLNQDYGNELLHRPLAVALSQGGFTSLRQFRNDVLHDILLAGFQILTDWPTHWHHCLERIASNEAYYRNHRENHAKRHSLPYVLSKQLPPDKYPFVWQEFESYVANEDNPITRQVAWDRFFSKTHARLPTQNMRFHEIKRQLPQQGGSELTLDQAAHSLGISRATLRQLTGEGLIHLVATDPSKRRTKWRYDTIQLEEFKTSLTQHSQGNLIDNHEMVLLRDAQRELAWAGISFSDLVQLIAAGKLDVLANTSDQSLASILISRASMAEVRCTQLTSIQDGLLSIYQVMAQLECGTSTLRKWYSAGILIPEVGNLHEQMTSWRYKPGTVSRFLECLISSSEAASIVGVAPRTILFWVKEGWLKAESGLAICDTHKYLFDRFYVQKWRQERMISREVYVYLGIKKRTLEDWITKGKIIPIKNMSQHPHWFWRADVKRLRDRQNTN